MKRTPVGRAFFGLLFAAAVIGPACATSGGSNFGGTADASGSSDALRTVTPDGGGHPLGSDATLGNPDTGHTTGPGMPHGCDVSCMAAGGTCANLSCTLNQNTGSLTPAQEQQLQAGGTADPAFTWLYPYDGTVFPRGLIPPTLQFGGTAPDALLVHITYSSMDYTGYFAGSSPGRVQLPALTWTAITYGAAATDTVVVSVTKLSGGQVSGPITESWSVAQGSMRGQIYYETYGSSIIGGVGGVGIMSIAPGATAPTPIAKGCGNVCHAASADGSTLVSSTGLIGVNSISYNLKTSPPSTLFKDSKQVLTYGGLYPDGTFAMSATNYRTWLGAESHLYNTSTGVQIAAPGWDGTFTLGGTTAFSPDGKLFAFNRNDLDQGMGHHLAIADFAVATDTFSNPAIILTDMAHTLAWPAFTPDDGSIVYHAGIGGVVDGGRAPATRPTTARPATSTASTSPRRPRSAWTRSTATARAARATCPTTTPTSASPRPSCPRPSAATSGSSSRATAPTETPSRRRTTATRTASSGSRRSTST